MARLALAAGVYVAVALAWLTATLLVPARDRPYAIGSTNGSAWNAAFVFNGTERLGGKSPEPQFTVYVPGHHYPEATQSQRDHIPIVPPSPTRLLARVGPLSGERLGLTLLIALLLGAPALICTALEDRRAGREEKEEKKKAEEAAADRDAPAPPPETAEGARRRIRRASAAGLALWTVTGIALFSDMARLHPRYVESFVPAVAALLGIGVAWACALGRGASYRHVRLGALAVALLAGVYYVQRLLYGRTGVWWITLAAALGALALALLAYSRRDRRLRGPLLGATIALTLVTVGAMSLSTDVTLIDNGVTDAGYVGALPSEEQRLVSSYVRAHQGSARYELAAESATQIGSLIVQDGRPVLVLTTYNARVFTTVAQLRQAIARGEVKYAFLNSFCGKRISQINAACAAPARWIRAHGTDVSRQAGLERDGVLWLLPGAKPA
jgi:hypothetical protein